MMQEKCKDKVNLIGNDILNETQPVTSNEFDKLGITYIEDGVAFVAGDRVITRSSDTNSEVKIKSGVSGVRLDIDLTLSMDQAFEGIRELIHLSPEIGRPLVAHVISGLTRACFKKAGFTPCTVLIVNGKSGMLKSSYVPQITQLYNRADGIGADTRFNSTKRFIEDILSERDECTVVIDDLHTAEAKSIKRSNEITAEEIIRRVSDNTGRGHKEGNSTVQKKFGCNVVFIGEYIIGRESTIPRALVVNLTKKIDGTVLDKYQRKQPLLVSTFYYYFLQWYVKFYQDICEWIDEKLTKFRKMTANSPVHGRLLDTQFYLQMSFMIFLEFCKDLGFITEEDALGGFNEFREQLHKLIQEQQERYESNNMKSDDVDYLKLIRKLYRKGKFRLADDAAAFQKDEHDGLIYYDCLCLRGKKLEKRLHKIAPDIAINDVIRELKKRKALKLVKDKRTVKISTLNKSAGAIRFYAIKLCKLQ